MKCCEIVLLQDCVILRLSRDCYEMWENVIEASIPCIRRYIQSAKYSKYQNQILNIKISKCSKYSKYQNMIEALVPCFQRYIQIFQISKELKVRGPPGFNQIFHHCHCLGQHFIASHQTVHIVLVSIY